MKTEHFSQTDIAAILGVDRTTVRAWTKAGMPYAEPTTRGKEAEFSLPVALYWSVWLKVSAICGWPELDPLHALALARAYSERDGFLESFPAMVGEYFDQGKIRDAMHYAIGFLDAAPVVRNTSGR